jgi:hypothetical protein
MSDERERFGAGHRLGDPPFWLKTTIVITCPSTPVMFYMERLG